MPTDFANEDVLWTEKYQPQNSSELVGNTAAIKKLHRLAVTGIHILGVPIKDQIVAILKTYDLLCWFTNSA